MTATQEQPNILLIFTDMQRFDTIGALGNGVIRTPHLDRLVREGTAFERAYTPSPVCVPARCSMHYGKYPFSTGCFDNSPMMDDNGSSYVERLGNAGYRTHAIGKLHFTPDHRALRGLQSRESQEEMVHRRDDDDYQRFLAEKGFGHIMDPHGVRSEMYYIPQVAQMPQELHPTQWIGDRSVRFINDSERKEQREYLIASGTWSYFYSSADDREYCYHNAVDPLQQHLVAADPMIEALRTALLTHLKEQGVKTAYEEHNGKLAWRKYPGKSMPDDPDAGLLFQDHPWSLAECYIPDYTNKERFRARIGDWNRFRAEHPAIATELTK